MTIEELLETSRFPDEKQKAVIHLLFTASWLRNYFNQYLRPFDLTEEQFNVLRILRGAHPQCIPLKEISARMIDRNSNTSRIVEKLRVKGLVNRHGCELDRRKVDISIAADGLKLLKKIDVELEKRPFFFENFPEVKARELNRLLHQLRSYTPTGEASGSTDNN